jgi:hypothetical protein
MESAGIKPAFFIWRIDIGQPMQTKSRMTTYDFADNPDERDLLASGYP